MKGIHPYDESPACDICGEDKATVSFEHVGACDECAEKLIREALMDLCGMVCATIHHQGNGHLAVCLAESGTEHDHC